MFSFVFHAPLTSARHHERVNSWKQTAHDVFHADRLPSVPMALTRAIECVRTRLVRCQGRAATAPPATVSPERELGLLRTVRHAARHYRRAQQALADHETRGGDEARFRALLLEVRLSHGRLDAALLDIQLYYEGAGLPDD
jgi:hypothetical protein